jgi:hypothetical protein
MAGKETKIVGHWWSILKGGSAPCPVCGGTVKFLMGDGQRYLLCNKCGEYLRSRNRICTQMETDHISETAIFSVPLPWPDLDQALTPNIATDLESYVYDVVMTKKGNEQELSARWPSGCCICGAEATSKRVAKLTVNMPGKKAIRIRDEEVVIIAEGIPYCTSHKDCARHKDGVSFRRDAFDTGMHWVLSFRSYAYRNAFRHLNSWADPWTRGEAL